GCETSALWCLRAAASQVRAPAATPSPDELVWAQNRRHSLDRHYAAWFQRNPRRMYTRMNRCMRLLHLAANLCRNIRSWVESAAPSSSPSETNARGRSQRRAQDHGAFFCRPFAEGGAMGSG